MNLLTFLPQYVLWHYSTALVDLARAVSNFFWFLWNFFSIELLARSFFVPWKRLGEAQGSLVGRAIVGIAMRGIGVVARLALFAVALFAFIAAFFAALTAFFLWFTLPFVIVFLIVIGVRSLFAI
ncbi:MAG: hypothetical protein Q8R17_02320 [bacterium]|nr:hypothetical protein [bacterium]